VKPDLYLGGKKMIEVEVENYCQDCEEFEPRCYTSVSYRYNKDGDPKRMVRTSICCRHRDRCRVIHESAVNRAKEIIKEEEETNE
jgi:hypothetical protein